MLLIFKQETSGKFALLAKGTTMTWNVVKGQKIQFNSIHWTSVMQIKKKYGNIRIKHMRARQDELKACSGLP